MFTLSDYKQVGMPTLATVATAEGAWKLADMLGIREHAAVLPADGPTWDHYEGFWREPETDRGAVALAEAL